MVKMKMFSRAGVMYMDHIILEKVIGKYGWQFVLVKKYSYEQIAEFDKYEVHEE